MAQLEFRVANLEMELEAMKEMGRRYLDPSAPTRLDRLRYQLKTIFQEGRGRWSIPADEPICTKATNQYNKGHGESVWAEVTSVWELRRIRRTQTVQLVDIASSKVSLLRLRDGNSERVAMWRMEVGNEGSPGTHFHTHVLGDSAEIPYPDWLPVPRLLGLLPTPATALEFALAELFQEEWSQHTSQMTGHTELWAGIQKQRMTALFEWHKRILGDEGEQVVPWTSLKKAKPDATLVAALAR
jgi:hypothetical protein